MATLIDMRADVREMADDSSLGVPFVDMLLRNSLKALTPHLKMQVQSFATLTAADESVVLPSDVFLLLAVHDGSGRLSLRDGDYQVIGDSIVFKAPYDGMVVTVTYYRTPVAWGDTAEPDGVPDMFQDLLVLHASAHALRREECAEQFHTLMNSYRERLRDFAVWAARHRGYKPPLTWRMAQ